MVRERKNIQKNSAIPIERYLGGQEQLKKLNQLTRQDHWEFWPAQSMEQVLKNSYGLLFFIPSDDPESPWQGLVFAQSSFETSELLFVYTDPKKRRGGLGRSLLEHLIFHLQQTGNQEALLLEVRPSNIRAIKLYESLGWQVIHKRERYYQDGEDAIIYRLPLIDR